MIFEALFLAFTLGKEKAQCSVANQQIHQWKNDTDIQRKRFFADQKKWKKDTFAFGDSLNDLQWSRILELLDLIDKGYFPVSCVINNNDKSEIRHYGLEKYVYKTILNTDNLVSIYLKLSDAKIYFEHGGTCRKWLGCDGKFHSSAMTQIFDLLNNGKVKIGLPFGEGGELKIMTTNEARKYMKDVMEERFQKQR